MSAVVDTGVLFAFFNSRDEGHDAAVELMKRAANGEFGKLLLPEYVFDEAVTLTMARAGNSQARQLGEWLLSSEFELVYSDSAAFSEAWTLFKKFDSLSFTDCIIAAIALRRDAVLLTFDKRLAAIPKLRVV